MPREVYKYNPDDIKHYEEVIKAHKGHITRIASTLGVSRQTVYAWQKTYPEFNKAFDGLKVDRSNTTTITPRITMEEKVMLLTMQISYNDNTKGETVGRAIRELYKKEEG